MLTIQYANLGGIDGYYTNLGKERLTIDKSLSPEEERGLIEKTLKNRPAHSQPVSA